LNQIVGHKALESHETMRVIITCRKSSYVEEYLSEVQMRVLHSLYCNRMHHTSS